MENIVAMKTCFIVKPKDILSFASVVALLAIGFDVKIEKLKEKKIYCYSFTIEGASYIEQVARDHNCKISRVTTSWEEPNDSE